MHSLSVIVLAALTFSVIAPFTCSTNNDCQFHIVSKCASGICISCSTDSDCSHINGANSCRTNSDIKYCHTACGQSDENCKVLLAVCGTGNICRRCNSDVECSDLYGSGAKCLIYEEIRYCGFCQTNSECTDGKICNERFQCVPCTDSSQCTSPQICDLGRCKSCLSNSNCSGNKPICNTDVGACRACINNNECPGSLKCNTGSGECVECLSNTDCPSENQPICRSNTCQACLEDSECSTKRCNLDSGKCVDCLEDSDCTDPYQPVCNSNNQCEKCTSDTQ